MKNPKSFRKSSLRYSTIEGSWWAIMFGSGETYLGAFFEFLKYTGFQISILMTFPILIGSTIQPVTSYLFHIIKSRKRMLIAFFILQSILWLCFIGVGLYAWSFTILLVLVSLYYIVAFCQAAPWLSWMGYLVPPRIRGRYFANRLQIIMIVALFSSIVSGIILYVYSREDSFTGFAIIFFIAFISRLISTIFISKKYEPPYSQESKVSKKIDFNSKSYKKVKNLIIFESLFYFSIHIWAPLTIVYWMRDLNFNYLDLAIVINGGELLSLFGIRYLGRRIDSYGTHPVIVSATFGIMILPILWYWIYLLPTSFILPSAIIIQAFAKLFFRGFMVSMDNRLLELMNGKNIINIASKRLYNRGFLIFFGGLLGGYLSSLDYSDIVIIHAPLQMVMLVAFAFRLSVWFFFCFRNSKSF